jgi:hypothetical protein
MLADKFWIGPKGEILWVVDNYEDCILDNLEFFNLNKQNAICKNVYKLGFIEGELTDECLILRSPILKYLYESLNKIKNHIADINKIEFHLLIDNKIMVRSLCGKKEIDLFLTERIFARNGKYIYSEIKEQKTFLSNLTSIIHKLYAKKTKSNLISK